MIDYFEWVFTAPDQHWMPVLYMIIAIVVCSTLIALLATVVPFGGWILFFVMGTSWLFILYKAIKQNINDYRNSK